MSEMEPAQKAQSQAQSPAAERVSPPGSTVAGRDSRPVAVAQRQLAEAIDRSPHAVVQRAVSAGIHNGPHGIAQRTRLNGTFGPSGGGGGPGGPVIQRARWLFTEKAWINPDTLAPIGQELKPPAEGQEGDVWDDQTGEVTSAGSRLDAIFAGTGNRAPKLNFPSQEEFQEQLRDLGKPGIEERVEKALEDVPTEKLSKDTILAALGRHFRDYRPGLHAATRDPSFSETLLEGIRNRQGGNWIRATAPQKVPTRQWFNQELQHWNVRHYTSKLNVELGEDLGEGIFRVREIEAPPFNEIISTVTLATLKPGGGVQNAKGTGDRMLLTYTGGASSSGHTTGLDWANVGNVGDTFYGLFYKDKPATGLTPSFIADAVYYARWSVQDFGVGWASADWLGTAAHSREDRGETPGGIARTGQLSDIIASIFPEAATRDFSQTGNVETPESEEQRKAAFAQMSNFEIKKHGPMPVNAWLPIATNIAKARLWWVDTTRGKFVKLSQLLPKSVQEKL